MARGRPGDHDRDGQKSAPDASPTAQNQNHYSSSWCCSRPKLTSSAADARSHQRSWLDQGVAAVHAGDGGKLDRSYLEPERGVAVQSAAVATAADGLNMVLVDEHGVERLKCVRMQPKRGERVLENTFGVLMTG